MSISKITLNTNHLKSNTHQNAMKNFKAQQATSVLNNNKNTKNKIILTGLGLIILGSIAYWKRETLGLTKAVKSISKPSIEKIETKIIQLKSTFKEDAQRVLKENTHNNIVNLSAIEPAAAIRSASKTESEPFHQAATWIEEAYIDAYSKAELKDGNNILNYIYKRVASENNTLAKMYAQMPKAEAEVRIKQFATEATQKDTHTGLTINQFIEYMTNKLVPKAKQDLN